MVHGNKYSNLGTVKDTVLTPGHPQSSCEESEYVPELVFGGGIVVHFSENLFTVFPLQWPFLSAG